jgi:pimeloyl-ACP methyl ester carboxylesterase
LPSHRIIYLHGFASSPHSRKAQFFAEKLEGAGYSVEIPDLAAGDFEHLTISGQLAIVSELLTAGPAVVIGSSLGGYLAALSAARHPDQIERVILLAPAFGFYELWTREVGQEKLASWRRNGSIPVFHYGVGKELPLAIDLMDNAAKFESFPEIRQPGLLFHGVADPVVPIENSRSYAANHPNIRLMEFKSGHELTDVLDDMWLATRDFMLGSNL